MNEITTSTPFILALTLGAYVLGSYIYKKSKFSLLHPVLTSLFFIIIVLKIADIDYETYKEGSYIIDFMLGPSVVALGYLLYEQINHIKGELISILTSITVGAVVGLASVIYGGRLLGCDEIIIASLEPKSVTTPIAMSLSELSGGITSLTAIAVIVSGIFGGIAGPYITQKVGIKSKVARGLSLGAAAHGLGTARALEIGAIEGAIAGLSIGLMGIATSLIMPLFN